jgi:hypothetical protein
MLSLEDLSTIRVRLQSSRGISTKNGFLKQKSTLVDSCDWLLLSVNPATVSIVDHKTETLYGECFAPIQHHCLPVQAKDKCARFDLGGELGKSTDIVRRLERVGCSTYRTQFFASERSG